MDGSSASLYEKLEAAVSQRLSRAETQINSSLEQIAIGNPLGAETDQQRARARIAVKTDMSMSEAATEVRRIEVASRPPFEPFRGKEPRMEAVIGSTLDFIGVSFLTKGRAAADAVVRIRFRDGRPHGTGFLVAPGIIMTNNHVIPTPIAAHDLIAEFNFEKDEFEQLHEVTSYSLAPERLFVFDPVERLDYTLIAIGERLSGPLELAATGFLILSDASNKHMLGEVANIIQHPNGDYKQVVLRENRLVSRLDYVLHYIADTERGSSGSPVFNNDWQVIALHHWGGPSPAVLPSLGTSRPHEINEGVRVSSIVTQLREKAGGGHAQSRTISSIIETWDRAPARHGVWSPNLVANRPLSLRPASPATAINPEDARFKMPSRRNEDFSDRAGYEAGFLSDFIVPLPKLSPARAATAARNLDARIGEDPFELRYHHFSIVMNAARRLAYFTACNIDGRLTRGINRTTKIVDPNPTPASLQIESTGAEASDDFAIDWRIHPDQQMGIEFYKGQKVPGYPDPNSRDRIARMFQKGHIIMRSDPAWGSIDMALAAERDTFFYTNAAPQLGFFNQGSRDNRPGEKGKLRWRAVETYVLRNAVKDKERVCVFAGPVFDDATDPEYRSVQVPMKFWKIVVWSIAGEPRSIALLADQQDVLDNLTNGIPEAMLVSPEAYDDIPELRRIKEFRTTVKRIEALTGIDFSDLVRDADIGAGVEEAEIVAADVLAGKISMTKAGPAASPDRQKRRKRTRKA